MLDDCLLDTFAFLMREHIERLQLVCRRWKSLIDRFSVNLPLRPIDFIEVSPLPSIWWSFFLPTQTEPLEHWEKKKDDSILDILLAANENEAVEASTEIYNIVENIRENRPFFCRICAFPIKPFSEKPSKLTKSELFKHPKHQANQKCVDYCETDLPKIFEEHMRSKHGMFCDYILKLAETSEFFMPKIPCFIQITLIVEELGAYDNHVCREEDICFYIYYLDNNAPNCLSKMLTILSDCCVFWMRILILNNNAWNFLTKMLKRSYLELNKNIIGIDLMVSEKITALSSISYDFLSEFYKNFVDLFGPKMLFAYFPIDLYTHLKAINHSEIFPTKCAHLDLQHQQNLSSSFESNVFELLKVLIFANGMHQKKQNFYHHLRWMVRLKGQMDGNKELFGYWNGFYREMATSSLSIFPFPQKMEWIVRIIELFLRMESTIYLRGRRLRFCNALWKESFSTSNFNVLLHELWLKMDKTSISKFLTNSQFGEYVATNPTTGDAIVLIFKWHSYELNRKDNGKYKEIHKANECQYKEDFVLEFPLMPDLEPERYG